MVSPRLLSPSSAQFPYWLSDAARCRYACWLRRASSSTFLWRFWFKYCRFTFDQPVSAFLFLTFHTRALAFGGWGSQYMVFCFGVSIQCAFGSLDSASNSGTCIFTCGNPFHFIGLFTYHIYHVYENQYNIIIPQQMLVLILWYNLHRHGLKLYIDSYFCWRILVPCQVV